jgi:phenylacetate-CoA ligase
MGIGDISPSLWGECPQQQGMHLGGRGFVHIELIDPDSGASVPLSDGARGELVLTHLRQQAVPLLRFRTRDHVMIWTEPCACGRTSPRVRCIGRTDDMLIVRGVNVFPSAVREVVNRFAPDVSGVISIRPAIKGVKQSPPLKLIVELAENSGPAAELAARIESEIRSALVFSAAVELASFGTLPRSEYKSKIVDFSEARSQAGQ